MQHFLAHGSQSVCVWEWNVLESRKEMSYYSLTFCICQSHGRTQNFLTPRGRDFNRKTIYTEVSRVKETNMDGKGPEMMAAGKTLNQSRDQQEPDD